MAVRETVDLPVRRSGRRGAPRLLLLHGYSDSAQSFDLLVPRLAGDLDLLAVDLRGHGDAPRPDEGYDVGDHVADVVAVLDRAGWDRTAVLGHSMGTLVARGLAAEHPGRVGALVLVGALPPAATAVLHGLREEVGALGDEVPETWVREFQASASGPRVPAAFLDEVVARSHRVPARVWRAVADGLVAADDSASLSSIEAPVLLLWGDRDGITTEQEQRQLVATVRDATLRVLHGVGHAPHWEDPEELAREVLSFLSRRA